MQLFPRGDVVSPPTPNPSVTPPDSNPTAVYPAPNPANPTVVSPTPPNGNPAAVRSAPPAPVAAPNGQTATPVADPNGNPYQTTPPANPANPNGNPAVNPANPNPAAAPNPDVPLLFTPDPTPDPATANPAAPTPEQVMLQQQQDAINAERAQLQSQRDQLWQSVLASVNPAAPGADPNAPPTPNPYQTTPPANPAIPTGNPAAPSVVPGRSPDVTMMPPNPTAAPEAPNGFAPIRLDPTNAEPNELYLAGAYNNLGSYTQGLEQQLQQVNQTLQAFGEQQTKDRMSRAVDDAAAQFGVSRDDIFAMYDVHQVGNPYALAEIAAGRIIQHQRANDQTAQAVDTRVDQAAIVGGTPTAAPATREEAGRGVTDPFDLMQVAQAYTAIGYAPE